MASDNGKVIPFSPPEGRSDRPADRHTVLARCQNLVVRHLQELAGALFDAADDALFELADKAETNAVQTLYFDSMRLVRIQRRAIETAFAEAVAEAFHRLQLAGTSVEDSGLLEAFSLENAGLVADTDLEEDLAVSGIAGKVKTRCGEQLRAIELRLADLLPSLEIDDENNPFGPVCLAEAFRTALGNLEADIRIKLILYKLFDKHVAAHLEDLYAELNHRFAEAGVLPTLPRPAVKRSSTPAASAPEGLLATDPGGDGETLLATLHQLLAARAGAPAGTPAAAGGVAASAVAAGALGALDGLQAADLALDISGTAGTGPQALGSQVKAVLLKQVRAATGDPLAQLNPLDADTIDLVSMLFDFILDDRNLPAAVKALVARLQIPLIKAAMLERQLFANKSHPARRLLNTLAEAGLGLGGEETVETTPQYRLMARAVERVLQEFTDDTALFGQVLEELERGLADAEAEAAAAGEAALAQRRQREAARLAHSWIAEALRERLHGRTLPRVVVDLVTGPWKEVLVDSFVEHGQDSRQFKEQLRFVDILAWSVEPKHSAMERQKLAGVILQLLETFRAGLRGVGVDEETIEAHVRALEPVHLACFHGRSHDEAPEDELDRVEGVLEITGSDTPPPELEETAGGDDDTSIAADITAEAQARLDEAMAALEAEPPADEALDYAEVDGAVIEDIVLAGFDPDDSALQDMPEDEYLQLARHLEMGRWVEFRDDDGRTRRARLAWKSDLLGECTFVDWKFKVVADTTIQGFAADLRRGTARVIDEVPLFDRAMEAVVSGLRRKAAAQ